MSKVKCIDTHNNNIIYKYENNGRKGVRYQVSPRRWVERWVNPQTSKENKSTTGDLWVSVNILTEDVRKIIEEVAEIKDSPWGKGEKMVVVRDDTNANRIKLFNAIVEKIAI